MSSNTEQEIRSRVYDNLGLISQTMASPIRLRILQTLANCPSSVEVISQKTAESIANTSQHLQKMLKAGLLKCEKQGVSRIYSLANEQVIETWVALQSLAHSLSPQIREDEAVLCPPELCTDLSLQEVLKLVRLGKAQLVDARDDDDALGSAVPEALHIRFEDLKAKKSALAKSKVIFVFCRGRYCGMANSMVETLRKNGYKAFRLREMAYEIKKSL